MTLDWGYSTAHLTAEIRQSKVIDVSPILLWKDEWKAGHET